MDWLHWTLIGTTVWFFWKSYQWQREEHYRCCELIAKEEELMEARATLYDRAAGREY